MLGPQIAGFWIDLDGFGWLVPAHNGLAIATACYTNCCRGFCPGIHDAGRPLSFCIRMGQRYPKVTFYCPRHVQHETLRIVRGAAATSPAPGTKCRADACCGVRSWLSPQSFRGSHMFIGSNHRRTTEDLTKNIQGSRKNQSTTADECLFSHVFHQEPN